MPHSGLCMDESAGVDVTVAGADGLLVVPAPGAVDCCVGAVVAPGAVCVLVDPGLVLGWAVCDGLTGVYRHRCAVRVRRDRRRILEQCPRS